MTNAEIFNTAMRQSAIDLRCDASDFLSFDNKVVLSEKSDNARRYLELPFVCNLVSYGNNIVASVTEELSDIVLQYINSYPVEHCFETPNMHVLRAELLKHDCDVCYMAEYFLPDVDILRNIPCNYDIRIVDKSEFCSLYLPQWSNALCDKRKYLDVLAIGAYDGEKLIGLAGCSADCDTMWQIGIDVLPEYRRQGIASALTSRIAIEMLKCGKVPFYCAAWSNIPSVRNAIRAGFRPAWIEMTAKSIEFINNANNV